MFIGGSPGSTAGGIKTTTFGVIAITAISTIRGEQDVAIFKKRIGEEVIKKIYIYSVYKFDFDCYGIFYTYNNRGIDIFRFVI